MKKSELINSMKKDFPLIGDAYYDNVFLPTACIHMAENYFVARKDNELLREYLTALNTLGFYSFEREE